MRSTWTDSRLDDFKSAVEARLDELSGRVDGLDKRIDLLQHTMVSAFIALVALMVSGFIGLAGLILLHS